MLATFNFASWAGRLPTSGWFVDASRWTAGPASCWPIEASAQLKASHTPGMRRVGGMPVGSGSVIGQKPAGCRPTAIHAKSRPVGRRIAS